MNAKLTKGLAAAAISAAMMLGAAAPALAAETATPISGTEVPVKVTYDETGNGDAPEETISYTPGNKSFTGNAYYSDSDAIPLVSIKPVTVDADGTGAAKSEGSLVVTVPESYAAVGTYTYNFTRTAINDAGVTDNVPTGLTVVVTVTNKLDKDGNVLEGQFDRYVVIKDANKENTKYDDKDGVNLSYAAGQLTVTKKVTGNLGDQSASNKFPFEIKLSGLKDKNVKGEYHYSVAGVDSTDTIKFNKDGEAYLKAEIAHNESIVIKDLPAGVNYEVKELKELNGTAVMNLNEKNPDNGYTLAKIETNGSDYGSIAGADKDQATYTNEKTGGVATGVLLNNAPYIAILGGAAVVAIYVVNKRRHSDMD
jgi:hypothetical protein